MRHRRVLLLFLAALPAAALQLNRAPRGAGASDSTDSQRGRPGVLRAQRFYDDDPLVSEPAPRPVGALASRKLSDYYDFFRHLLSQPGQRQPVKGEPIGALDVNTLGEPMAGAWYTPRHYARRLSLADLSRGSGHDLPPSAQGPWTVVSAKNEGVTPGFVVIDANQRRYYVKFDPLSNPEIATGADQISTKIFYALGYHVAENHIVQFNPGILRLGADVEIADRTGKARKMTSRDLTEILMKAPRGKDGRYRATVSLGLPGIPIGPFRYFGTRADDPNDTVPHEHRRELRGLHVFCAWLGHDDSRSINTLDVVVDSGGRQFVRHYLMDFGSTLGSASNRANSPRSGGEYLFDWKIVAQGFFSLGLHVPYWAKADFPRLPSVGRFESKVFDADRWVPEYPNPAFVNRLPDDEFWAAKQVLHFTDSELRAIVKSGEYSDPAAENWIYECLRERRDKIGKAFFAKVLPLDRFAGRNGRLEWEDLGAARGWGAGPVEVAWAAFDNADAGAAPWPDARGPEAPRQFTSGYARAELTAPARPGQTVRAYVRRRGAEIEVVGLERTWANRVR
jgi:hypothetical protein